MRHKFNGSGQKSTVFNLNFSNWNTSYVTNLSHMFIYAGRNAAAFNLNLSGWDVTNVTSFDSFNGSVEDKVISPNFE